MSLKRTAPLTFAGTESEHIRRVAQVVNELQRGVGNHGFRVTLDPAPAVATVVIRADVTLEQVANLTPASAAAAVDMAAGTTWAETSAGKVTIHHASGGAGRIFGVVLAG